MGDGVADFDMERVSDEVPEMGGEGVGVNDSVGDLEDDRVAEMDRDADRDALTLIDEVNDVLVDIVGVSEEGTGEAEAEGGRGVDDGDG